MKKELSTEEVAKLNKNILKFSKFLRIKLGEKVFDTIELKTTLYPQDGEILKNYSIAFNFAKRENTSFKFFQYVNIDNEVLKDKIDYLEIYKKILDKI